MSDKPASRAGSWLHILTGDVTGTISTLGHARATVVGADTGAVIARAAADRSPHHIERVIALPASRGFASAATRLHPRLLGASTRLQNRIWRASLAADTTPAFHNSPRFQEFLRLRSLARDIDNALPHIVETSRLRPLRAATSDVEWFSRLPHIEDPGRFTEMLVRALS